MERLTELRKTFKDRDLTDEEILEILDSLYETHQNYLNACKTIAKMQAATVGKSGIGSKRGLVEDIINLRKELDDLKFAYELAQTTIRSLENTIGLQTKLKGQQ